MKIFSKKIIAIRSQITKCNLIIRVERNYIDFTIVKIIWKIVNWFETIWRRIRKCDDTKTKRIKWIRTNSKIKQTFKKTISKKIL